MEVQQDRPTWNRTKISGSKGRGNNRYTMGQQTTPYSSDPAEAEKGSPPSLERRYSSSCRSSGSRSRAATPAANGPSRCAMLLA
jgi:hypothetical protein